MLGKNPVNPSENSVLDLENSDLKKAVVLIGVLAKVTNDADSAWKQHPPWQSITQQKRYSCQETWEKCLWSRFVTLNFK